MNDPMKIMDEIERNNHPVWGCLLVDMDVKNLRAAIEFQAEELRANAHDIDRMLETISAMEGELAQKDARIERLEFEMQCFVEKVESGRARSRNTYDRYKEALNEAEPQSLAAVKAQALREAAEDLGGEVLYRRLHNRADRIESEAKE